MEGYSGTPLAKKLGIKSGFKIVLVNRPKHYKELFADFPEDIIEVLEPKKEQIDFIHVFCVTLNDLKTQMVKLKPLLKKDGLIWVSWPKGASKIETELSRDIIRDYMLSEIKLVDVKVAAIDADWSGLKFVYRKVDRKKT
ncbi:DUF3052 domain-containing protein [Aestuariivivens insulae]|uniref:DUF3052 domain-containing protein n=1 Tax=Aestuariivivens insulae TaxID=1621988 RepID=UPI001F57D88B|nr:DUF3052 domain-containing protein [Aestuariivivens insulae]